ncbi:MAG TPA: efflux transporter outer membrane subunit [Candidatus Binatia bacterium]
MKYLKTTDKFYGLAAWLCFLAAGCSVGPDYRPPETATPGAWQEAQQSGVDTQAGDLTEWWKEFKDPLLDSLVERAVKSNLDLRIAEARVREERATLAATAAGLWPTLDVSGSYSRNRASQNAIGSPTQGAVVAPTGARQLENNFYKTGFDSSWEIDVFGGTRRQIEGAEAILQASIEERRGVLVTLLGDVARNYIDLRGLQRRLEVAQENLRAQQDTLGLTRVRFDAGLASDFEVAQSEGEVATTAAQIPTLQSALKQAAYRLDVLLGTQPGTTWDELARTAPIPALPPEAHVGLPADLLRRRPDIRSAERQLAAATAQVGAATANLYPRFSLLGNIGLQSISASDWITAQSRFWSIGPTISWPVFDAGRIRATIEIRNAQQEQALKQYEKSVLTAFEDVENALVNYGNEQIRYRSLLEAVAANRRALEMANDLYIQGLVPFLNVLDAQRTLYATEADLAQSEANMAANLVALYKALGGGWETG